MTAHLLTFVRKSFLSDDEEGELDEDTPLLEYGILNSLNTAMLIAHIRQEFGIAVPLADVTAESFKTVAALSSMLYERQSVADARVES
jgi:clorobiocin biosynthesis protein CloN5